MIRRDRGSLLGGVGSASRRSARWGSALGFWEWHSEVMLRYAEAMLRGGGPANPDGYDEAAFGQVPGSVEAAVVPGVAVLDAAGAWPLQPDFEQMIMAATGALQIINDLGHAVKDLEPGNRTWFTLCSVSVSELRLNRGRLIGGVDRVFDRISGTPGRRGRPGQGARRARGGGVGRSN